MKKNIIITLVITLLSLSSVNACDICGCGVGNYYIGLLPQFNKKFIGIRYHYRSFNTLLTGDATQFSKDRDQSIELWGGWNIGKRWQLLAIVPYNITHQVSDDCITNHNGLGDIVVMGNYKIFDKATSTKSKKLITQQLIGGGVKLATGQFNVDATASDIAALANTQLGSSTTNFMLNSLYNIHINKLGINSSATYKINTTNSDKYYFGNKLSISSIVYRSIKAKKVNITPNV